MRLSGLMTRVVREPHALHGGPRLIVRALHTSMVAQELLFERALDALAPPQAADESLAEKVTVLIKTFERPRILTRFVASVRRLYPTLRIVVVDDSRQPVRLPGVATVEMPYDSGIGAGRNEGLKRVTTPYVLVADDDFVFYRETRLAPALSIMEQHAEIDIMGGQLIDLPLFKARPVPRGAIFPTRATPIRPIGSSIEGLEVVDKVATFFLARTRSLDRVRWDAELKRVDHADFFTRALGVVTTVFNPHLRCLHARTPFDASYMRKRLDVAESLNLLTERYGP